jgi:hypothetical protein
VIGETGVAGEIVDDGGTVSHGSGRLRQRRLKLVDCLLRPAEASEDVGQVGTFPGRGRVVETLSRGRVVLGCPVALAAKQGKISEIDIEQPVAVALGIGEVEVPGRLVELALEHRGYGCIIEIVSSR